MTDDEAAFRRVKALVAAAARLVDSRDPLGIDARAELPGVTGLSPEGVELALGRCLEIHPSDDEVRSLVRSVPRVPRAHVLLSANVFVAAHRAVALALASSPNVVVRPSRREPVMIRLLHRGVPDLFEINERLEPRAGDHLWAYGERATLDRVCSEAPSGVTVHGHGPGMGVVFVDDTAIGTGGGLGATAEAIVDDVILFDQRGCLSPRIVFVLAEASLARTFAEGLAHALARATVRVPPGRLDGAEIAARARYRDALLAAGAVLPAGEGFVGLDLEGRALVVPPSGRNVHFVCCMDPERLAAPIVGMVTSVGVAGRPALAERAASRFPEARITEPGRMQTPPFDGPVDRRSG